MRALTVFSFITTLALSTTAFAQETADADSAAMSGKSGDSTLYSFDDDNVDGEILSPDGANIGARGRVKHASLINIRPHFLPELISLALDV